MSMKISNSFASRFSAVSASKGGEAMKKLDSGLQNQTQTGHSTVSDFVNNAGTGPRLNLSGINPGQLVGQLQDLALRYRQNQGVQNALNDHQQYGEQPLTDTQIAPYRVHDGDWCGMFVGAELGLNRRAREGIASTSKALGFFTTPDSGRQFFMLEGTDTAGKQWTNHGALQNGLPEERYTPEHLPIRPGDVVIFDDGFKGGTGHIGMVRSYEPPILTTVEGNVDGGKVVVRTYDLSDPEVAAQFDGFGRPALTDFQTNG